MTKILLICSIGTIIGLLADRLSERSGSNGSYVRKNTFCFVALAIIAGIYVGLRTRYNDTVTYIYGYNLLNSNGDLFSGMDWSLGENPGFWVVSRVLRHVGATSQDFLMIFALTTVAIYVWFLRKYTTNISLGVFLFMFVGGYTLVFAAIKQCFAIALCLIAADRYLEGKKIAFATWILLAMTFHPYSFMYFLVPFLTSSPWTKQTYIIIGISLLAGAIFPYILDIVIGITSSMGESYTSTEFSGKGVNSIRVIVAWVPIALSFLKREEISRTKDPIRCLFMNMNILSACIMFLALFGTANYIGRLSQYFPFGFVLAFPWVLSFYGDRERRGLTILSIMCYLAYFAYQYGIANGGFDVGFAQVELLTYLGGLV